MEKFQIYFFTALFLGVLFLNFQIFLPFLVPVSIAAMLAFLLYPLHERIADLFGNRRGISAFVIVLLAVFVVIIPLFLIGTKVFQEAVMFSGQLNSGGAENIFQILTSAEEKISSYFPGTTFNFKEQISFGLNFITQNIGNVFAGLARLTINVTFNIFIGLIAFYYLLKDGEKLVRAVVALSPLPDKHDYEILAKLGGTVSSVVKGSLVISVIQGILSSIGLTIFGVPNPVFLGSIAAITALVPGVGTALINVPSIIYLFAIGSTNQALGLIVWWMLFVGLIDNMLGPMLMKRGIKVHPFLILLSVIGGLGFFGPVGFLLGPLVLSLLFAMIEIYKFLVSSDSGNFAKAE